MRSVRIIAHCPRCGKEEVYVIHANDTDSMYQKCTKCNVFFTIDQMNLLYEDNDGNKVEEMIFNSEK